MFNLVKLSNDSLGNQSSIWGQIFDEDVRLDCTSFPALCLWSDDSGHCAIVTLQSQLVIVQSIDLEWMKEPEINQWIERSKNTQFDPLTTMGNRLAPQLLKNPKYLRPDQLIADIHDSFIKTHHNPVCLQCWQSTCETIGNEGDKVGEAYSVRLVEPHRCGTFFHEGD